MTEQSFEEKTEEPTPKKRQEVKEKGEVAKSKELPSVTVLLAALISLSLFGSFMYNHIQIIMKGAFSFPDIHNFEIPELLKFAQNIIGRFIILLSPLFAAIFITAILSNIMQVGFIVSGESITPKLSKIDPIKGFGRLFSKQSFMELIKSLLKLTIVGGIAFLTIKGEMKNFALLGEMEINSIFIYILKIFFKIFIRCSLAMIILVIIDYAFQKWEFENRIKMTKQEVKDEFKKSEGDPLIKSRIRSIQMEMARKRMMRNVPEADVVITNPTHLAIALKYDSSTMIAPKVVAKGSRKIAQKIKDVALEHEIPILENKVLARNLYPLVEVDQEIPPAFYQTVAEVLAYIYRLKSNYKHGVS
ncbi:MAG: flagellar biosynthesis protein FlhB [Desulfobacteraceae bacterium]|jgi:flagellar biosynthesis protein FlhB|nr:flagellar biosynthesis protein FlhB [Desulfobacteraceae bacterium]MDH3720104.1 flagellar biosynthesis protein FlhB [Desulfobacteraceae bacterium]MDH3836168.1 flagellar biosynthesis protein FlhB [Desulfobacteraceae bacterium]MDH3873903.1 flagellar biosynthesis protein FlhB [Desulfobacteraceae bacterium]MDH3957232.1 flagellar biosynthesis protein FlhB [Desulfobacteraceae bacterium]